MTTTTAEIRETWNAEKTGTAWATFIDKMDVDALVTEGFFSHEFIDQICE